MGEIPKVELKFDSERGSFYIDCGSLDNAREVLNLFLYARDRAFQKDLYTLGRVREALGTAFEAGYVSQYGCDRIVGLLTKGTKRE